MTLSRGSMIALAALVAASSANSAELPSRKATRAAPIQACEINGKPGYRVPGSDICVKFSGYVTGQVSAGTLK